MSFEIIMGLVIFLGFLLLIKISKKFFYLVFILSLGTLALVSISGCSGTGEGVNIGRTLEKVEENTLTRISDIPFLAGSKVDIKSSLVMGEGKNWSGQLLVLVPEKKIEVFNYYVNNLGDFGWKEQTTIRGEISILNFVGDNNRVAIITE